MHTFLMAALLLLMAGAASAQSIPFQLVPDEVPRVEVAAHLGWEGVSKLELQHVADRYDSGFAGVAVGYFWTPHVKTELGVARSGRGQLYQTELIEMRGLLPVYRSSQHSYDALVWSPAVTYQFLRNQWVHPFVSGGAHVVRERHEVLSFETRELTQDTSVDTVPFVGGGVKVFVSERAFIRTDIRTTVAEADTRRISWTAGFGVDF
jgi:opacity protein-like surface antigen